MVANDLLQDARFLAYRFDFDSEKVAFLPVDRQELRDAASLKRDAFEAGRQFVEVPLADLLDPQAQGGTTSVGRPPGFIFHTAFCGSTFLSRCLDIEGRTVVLREPQLLLDAANAKRLQWRSRSTRLDYRDLPKLFLSLLQKHAKPTETLILKPINSVNNIAGDLLRAAGTAKSLLLYTDARSFALSTLRKGEGGKQTVRSMFDLLRCDFLHLANLQFGQLMHMTDLRIIMTLWRLQIEQAEELLKQFSAAPVLASLYGEVLARETRAALLAVNRFLELGIPAGEIASIAASEQRQVDAKNAGERFSLEKRAARYAQLESVYGKDLDDGLTWLVRNNPGTRLVPELTGRLPL